ncbi:MAG: O-antigen ligase family protein [Candidatus Omnitrophota bacterium]
MIGRVLYIVVGIGAFLSLLGILQYFNVLYNGWWSHKHFLSATYVNHNHFSGYLELVMPVLITIWISKKHILGLSSVLLLMITILIVTAFLYSQSLGAWISLFISFIVMNLVIVKNPLYRKRMFFVSFGMILIILILLMLNKVNMVPIDFYMTGLEAKEPSFRMRIAIWKGAMRMIREQSLFGVGLGTFRWGFLRFKPSGLINTIYYAHNDYLHIITECGIIPVIIFIGMISKIIKQSFSNYRNNILLLGCGVGILSISLHSLVDFNFHIPANMFLFVVYAAFIMRGEKLNMEENND